MRNPNISEFEYQMAFRFKLDESLGDGIRRIIIEQIGIADRELSRTNSVSRGIHESRKCCKRIRSLLRLSRLATGQQAYQRENKRFRDIARGLSGSRNLTVMIDTLDGLNIKKKSTGQKSMSNKLRSELKQLEKEAKCSFDEKDKLKARSELDKARRSIRRLKIPEIDFDCLAEGLENCYALGRKNFLLAYRDCTPEQVHEFRKTVQTHWRQMQLLSVAWPESFSARILLAKEISELLGDHNDLDLLACFAKEHSDGYPKKNEVKAFIGRCEKIQAKNRLEAYPKCRLLFAESAKKFRQRILQYWVAASDIEPISIDF